MSQWTHVAGTIRLDSLHFVTLRISDEGVVQMVKNALGTPVDFDGLMDGKESVGIPWGSEGSIQYEITPTRTNNSLSWGHVVLWGDLRDYEDEKEIHEWLSEALEQLKAANFHVRQAIVHIDVESKKKWVLVYNDHLGLYMQEVPGED